METSDLQTKLHKIQELAEEGIYIDGAHHKQWYLVEILKVLGVWDEELLDEVEEGIAP